MSALISTPAELSPARYRTAASGSLYKTGRSSSPSVLSPPSGTQLRNAREFQLLIVDAAGELASRLAVLPSLHGVALRRVRTAAEAYAQIGPSSEAVVILQPVLPDESGWLAAAKLRLTAPACRIGIRTEHPAGTAARAVVEMQASLVGADAVIDDVMLADVAASFFPGKQLASPRFTF